MARVVREVKDTGVLILTRSNLNSGVRSMGWGMDRIRNTSGKAAVAIVIAYHAR